VDEIDLFLNGMVRDDLIKLSFDDVQDILNTNPDVTSPILFFIPIAFEKADPLTQSPQNTLI